MSNTAIADLALWSDPTPPPWSTTRGGGGVAELSLFRLTFGPEAERRARCALT